MKTIQVSLAREGWLQVLWACRLPSVSRPLGVLGSENLGNILCEEFILSEVGRKSKCWMPVSGEAHPLARPVSGRCESCKQGRLEAGKIEEKRLWFGRILEGNRPMPEPLCPAGFGEFPGEKNEVCPLLVDWALCVCCLTTYGLASFQPTAFALPRTAGVGTCRHFSWSVGAT